MKENEERERTREQERGRKKDRKKEEDTYTFLKILLWIIVYMELGNYLILCMKEDNVHSVKQHFYYDLVLRY